MYVPSFSSGDTYRSMSLKFFIIVLTQYCPKNSPRPVHLHQLNDSTVQPQNQAVDIWLVRGSHTLHFLNCSQKLSAWSLTVCTLVLGFLLDPLSTKSSLP